MYSNCSKFNFVQSNNELESTTGLNGTTASKHHKEIIEPPSSLSESAESQHHHHQKAANGSCCKAIVARPNGEPKLVMGNGRAKSGNFLTVFGSSKSNNLATPPTMTATAGGCGGGERTRSMSVSVPATVLSTRSSDASDYNGNNQVYN